MSSLSPKHGFMRYEVSMKIDGFKLLETQELREKIYKEFKQIGFTYVTLDLFGYRTGSMNEAM